MEVDTFIIHNPCAKPCARLCTSFTSFTSFKIPKIILTSGNRGENEIQSREQLCQMGNVSNGPAEPLKGATRRAGVLRKEERGWGWGLAGSLETELGPTPPVPYLPLGNHRYTGSLSFCGVFSLEHCSDNCSHLALHQLLILSPNSGIAGWDLGSFSLYHSLETFPGNMQEYS